MKWPRRSPIRAWSSSPLAREMDEEDVGSALPQPVAVGALQRRAGDDGAHPRRFRPAHGGGDRVQPRPAVRVVERPALRHLAPVRLRMVRVALDEGPAEPLGERLPTLVLPDPATPITTTIMRRSSSGSPCRHRTFRSEARNLPAFAALACRVTHPIRRRTMAGIRNLDDLFLHTLKDIYYAEKQILKALPKMAKKAATPELRSAFEEHRSPDREPDRSAPAGVRDDRQVGARRQMRGDRGPHRRGRGDHGRGGGREHARRRDDRLCAGRGALRDRPLRHADRLVGRAEHGPRIADLLSQTLEEEKQTDQKLTQLAEQRENRMAA